MELITQVNISQQFGVTKLDNGLRVVTEQMHHVGSLAAGIWLGVGSRHETEPLEGVCHFIEHMLFKGTGRRSARDIAEEVDAVGGQLNAFTGKEYTCCYARMLTDHLDLTIDLLSDMIANSRFDDQDIERERQVILEEISMVQDSPDELVHDLLSTSLFRDHGLGKPVLGFPETVAAVTRSELLDCYDRFYRPDNMVVAVAGNVEHDQVVEYAERYLGHLRGGKGAPTIVRPSDHPDLQQIIKPIEQVHICVGAAGVPFGTEDYTGIGVLSMLLGGGSSSRLFQTIREEHGLAYSVFAYETAYQDSGMIAVYAGTSRNQAGKTLELILTELQAVANGHIDEQELSRAREQIRSGLVISLESTNTRMNRIGRWILSQDRVEPVEVVLESLNRVTVDYMVHLARRILDRRRLAAAMVGPVSDEVEKTWNEL